MNERRRSSRLMLLVVGATVLLLAPGVAQADDPLAPLAPSGVLSADPGVEAVPEGNVLGPMPASPDATAARVDLSPSAYAKAKADANRGGPRAGTAAAAGPLAPPTIRSFNCEGVNQTTAGGLRPPDVDGAVGNSHIVEVTNSHINMYVKPFTGACTAPSKSVSAASFFGYTAETLFDPRVIYDELWDRWVIIFEAFPESAGVQRLFIAASLTSNPTGAFFIYNINIAPEADSFYDYPQLGHDQDAVLFSANIFNFAGTAYKYADVFAVAKARLYNGLGFSVPRFQPTTQITIQPPVVLDQNPVSYFITARPPSVATATTLRKFTANNTANGFAMTFAGPASITVPSYSIPPSADQPGTTDDLDTLEARFVNRSTQIGDSLFQTHTVAIGSFASPKWYEIDTQGAGANTIKQSAFYFEGGLSDDWNASIAANESRDVFVTWSSTQGTGTSAHNARVRFSGRAVGDPAGVIPAGSSLFTSSTFYNPSGSTVERWGDYSAVALDPTGYVSPTVCASHERAWVFNEKINATAVWGRRYGRIGFC